MREYEDLANAIILSAVKDYKKALKAIQGDPDNRYVKGDLQSIEKFFYSDWYSVLTNSDPDYILQNLRADVLKENEISKT